MSDSTLLDAVRSHVDELGYELADFRQVGTAQRPILQVRVDRADSRPGHGVTADECAAISRSLERFLESRAMVGPRYVLEVSSPGIERPLRWPEHWRRFTGHRARVKARGLRGRPEAVIVGMPDDAHVELRLDDGTTVTVALVDVTDARLAVDWNDLTKGRGKG